MEYREEELEVSESLTADAAQDAQPAEVQPTEQDSSAEVLPPEVQSASQASPTSPADTFIEDEAIVDAMADISGHGLVSALEAMLFISNDPVDAGVLSEMLGVPAERIEAALMELQSTYIAEDRGIQLNERAGGWRLVTHPRYHELLEKYVVTWDKRKLSQAALESLCIVAYCQPVTRADVSSIRGVSSDSSITSLVEKGYIREVGELPPPSNAALYGTTKHFLERFGLKTISDLPELQSFAPDEATRTLISERLGLVKEQTDTYDMALDEDAPDMLEALTSAFGTVEKIDLDSIRFDEE